MVKWSASLLISLILGLSSISEAQVPLGASASSVPRNMEEYSAFSGLWRTDYNFRSTVHLSNQLSVAEIDAVLTIYMADGTSWDLPTVHLAKSGVTTVDLNSAIANAPKKVQSHLSSYGSARLRYQYAWQGAILANISILDEVRSLEYMSPFTFPPNQGKGETIPAKLREFRDSANGTTYEGLWFREGHNGGGFIGLANTTDNQLSVHVAMSGQRSNTARDVTLQGHATALIDLRDVFGLNDQRVGGVTVSHTGPSGALQVVGGLEDLTTGFSTNIPLFPVATRAREIGDRRLGSAGMMVNEQNPHLGFPPGLRFYPYAFFRNIASEVRTLHFSAWYQEGNTAQHLSLPDLVIQPGQARELDIHDVLNNYPDVSDLNLLYEFTGDYTDIIAATGSTDGTGNYVFPILPEAIAPSGAKNSAYWDAQGGFDTMYTIWNPTDSPEDLIVLVRYGAGAKYTLPIHLEEYASTMVDIGELIRTQQPDKDGNILSHDALQGSLLVSPAAGEPEDQMTAVISVGIYNARKGTCGMGCTSCYGVSQTQMSPSSFAILVDKSFGGNLVYLMCDGAAYPVASRSSWSSTKPSIASVQTAGQANPGLVTGVSAGSATISAYYGPSQACIPQYCSPPPQVCPQYLYGSSSPATVTPAPPQITLVTPSPLMIGQGGLLSIVGSGFSNAGTVSGYITGPDYIALVSPNVLSDSLITAGYAVPADAPQGTYTLTLNFSSYDGGSYPVYFLVPVSAPTVIVQQVDYTNSMQVWLDSPGNATPTAASKTVWTWESAYPSAFVAGNTISATATFSISPAPVSAISVRVEGAVQGLGLLTGTASISVGQSSFSVNLTGDTPFTANTTFANASLGVNWGISYTGQSCASSICYGAYSSSSPVYATLVVPSGVSVTPVPMTAVELGVGVGGASASTPSAVFTNTWSRFAGPANSKGWDGRLLYYYEAGVQFSGCATNTVLLLTQASGSGQCGAWAHLLMDALAVDGIASHWTVVTPIAGPWMIINNWQQFSASPQTFPNNTPWNYLLQLGIESNGGPGMVTVPPSGPLFGDLTSLTGLPGQNSSTPSEKAFNAHFIVKVDSISGIGGPYFDPSYGTTYTGDCDFETQAVAGYAEQIPNQPSNYLYARPSFGGCSVTLNVNP